MKLNQVILLFYLFLIGCTQFVTDNFPEHQPKPVVNATLVEGQNAQVYLSLSNRVDSTSIMYCTNAMVELYKNQQFIELLKSNGEGIYESEHIITEGTFYSCKIAISGYDTIVVSTRIPNKAIIQKVNHINIAGISEDGKSYPALQFTLSKLSLQNCFYELLIFYFNKPFLNEVELVVITDKIILNEGLPMALFSNELINDTVYEMYLNYSTNYAVKLNNGPLRDQLFPLIIELRSVSYDYYLFKKSYYIYDNGRWGDGIVSPMGSTSVYKNIENGYGIFCGYSFMKTDTIYPNTDGYYD